MIDNISEENRIQKTNELVKNVKKLDSKKEIVYTKCEYEESIEDEGAENGDNSVCFYRYPVINIDSEDVKNINEEIEEIFGFSYDDKEKELNNLKYSLGINYFYYINDKILSVVVVGCEVNKMECKYYNIDLSSLKKIENSSLVGKDVDIKKMKQKVIDFANKKFDEQIDAVEQEELNEDEEIDDDIELEEEVIEESDEEEYTEQDDDAEDIDDTELLIEKTRENFINKMNLIEKFDSTYFNKDGDLCARFEVEVANGMELDTEVIELNITKRKCYTCSR